MAENYYINTAGAVAGGLNNLGSSLIGLQRDMDVRNRQNIIDQAARVRYEREQAEEERVRREQEKMDDNWNRAIQTVDGIRAGGGAYDDLDDEQKDELVVKALHRNNAFADPRAKVVFDEIQQNRLFGDRRAKNDLAQQRIDAQEKKVRESMDLAWKRYELALQKADEIADENKRRAAIDSAKLALQAENLESLKAYRLMPKSSGINIFGGYGSNANPNDANIVSGLEASLNNLEASYLREVPFDEEETLPQERARLRRSLEEYLQKNRITLDKLDPNSSVYERLKRYLGK